MDRLNVLGSRNLRTIPLLPSCGGISRTGRAEYRRATAHKTHPWRAISVLATCESLARVTVWRCLLLLPESARKQGRELLSDVVVVVSLGDGRARMAHGRAHLVE